MGIATIRVVKRGYEKIGLNCVLLQEVEFFIKRNTLLSGLEYESHIIEKPVCCPRCLKAFIIKVAGEIGFNDSQIESLKFMFPGKIGHDGYYMDGDDLIRIE